MCQVLHKVNGDARANTENGGEPILYVCVCISVLCICFCTTIINTMLKLMMTLTQTLRVNKALRRVICILLSESTSSRWMTFSFPISSVDLSTRGEAMYKLVQGPVSAFVQVKLLVWELSLWWPPWPLGLLATSLHFLYFAPRGAADYQWMWGQK